MTTRSLTRWLLVAAAGSLLLATVLLVLAHTVVGRAFVWAWAERGLRGYGIDASASRVEYNLLTLDVRVRGLSMNVAGRRDSRFFSADLVEVKLSPRLLLGRLAARSIEIVNPRVVLQRAADGTANWPVLSGSTPAAPPRAVDLGSVRVRDLTLAITDEETNQSFDLRSLSLDLPAAVGGGFGSISLGGPAKFRQGAHEVVVQRLSGALRFDGLSLWLKELRGEASSNWLQLDGRIGPLFGPAQLDLACRGSIDLAEISNWVAVPGKPTGLMTFDGRINGAANQPSVALSVAAARLAWAGLSNLSLKSAIAWQSGAIEVSALALRLAGGELNGTARFTATGASKPGLVNLIWHQLPLAAIQPSLPLDLPFDLSASMDGRMDAHWADLTAAAVTLKLDNRWRGVPRPGRLDLDASVTIELRDGRWQSHIDGVVGRALRLAGSANGRILGDDLRASTLSGNVGARVEDLGAAWRVIQTVSNRRPGAAKAPAPAPALGGQAFADVSLAGTVSAPEIRATLRGEQVRYGSFEPASLAAHVTAASGRVDIDSFEAQSGANVVRGGGGIALASCAIEARLEAGLADLGALSVGLPESLRAVGSATVTADVSGTWLRPRVQLKAAGDQLLVAGQTVDRWSTDLHTDGDDAIHVDALEVSQLSGRLSGRGWYNWADRSYTATLIGQSLTLAPLSRAGGAQPIPLRAKLDVDFDGSGSLADPRGRGRVAASAVTWNGRELGSVTADFTVLQQSIQLNARVLDEPIVATATAHIVPLGRFTVETNIENLDVARLVARLAPGTPVFRGSLSMTSVGKGDLSDLASMSVDIDLRQLDGMLDSAPIRLRRPSRLRYANHVADVDDAEVEVGGTTLQIRGRMGPDLSQSLAVALDGRLHDLTPIVALAARGKGTVVPPLDSDGAVNVRLTARGDPARPSVQGDISVHDGRVRVGDLPAATGIALNATYQDDGFELQQLEGVWQGARVVASGRVPAALLGTRQSPGLVPAAAGAERARLTVRVESATQALLAPWLDADTLERVKADVAGTLAIEADALSIARVRGAIELQRAQATLAGIVIGQAQPTRIAIDDGRARVVEWEWTGPGSQIALSGEAQIAPRQNIDLTSEGHIDLALLGAFLPGVGTAGQARLQVRAHGPAAAPAFDGRIEVSDGQLQVADPQFVVTSLAGVLALSGERVNIIGHLEGNANGGTITLSGGLSYADRRRIVGDVLVSGRGLVLNLKGLQAEADADLTLTKTTGRPTLAGVVTIDRGAYRENLTLTGGLLAALRQQGVATSAAPTALEAIDLNVRVVSASDVAVDNNYAQLQMGSDLRLVGTAAQPGLIGRATVREGGQIFLGGNTYRIKNDGTIDFADANRIAPNLSITAATRVSGYDVTLNLKGTPEMLRTDLSSDPPLGQSDLISLLVTGRTLDQAGGGALAIPRDQVLGYLSGELLGTAGRAVGLDTVRIQRGLPDVEFNAGLVATVTDPGSRLTFGKNVTPDLQLVFSESLKQSGGLTWIVSYQVRHNIEARVVSLDSGDRLYDFRHDVSFGGPGAVPGRPAAAAPERVVAVGLTGEPGFAAGELLGRLKLTRGDRFDFFKWQRDRDRLEKFFDDRGFYEARVSATRTTLKEGGGSGVALEYDVHRGPSTIVAVEGYELPSDLVHALQGIWAHATFEQFLTSEVTATVREHLTDKGYLRPTVAARIEDGAEQKRLVVHVDPGPRTTDRQIRLSGNERLATRRLETYIKSHKVADAAWIDPAPLRNALLALYRDEGMLAASVRVRTPIFEGSRATLPVEIVEGPSFRIGTIALDGVSGSEQRMASRSLNLKTDAAYRPAQIELARQRLQVAYRKDGFTAATVTTASRVVQGSARVDVSVQVVEGPRHVLRDIVITGDRRTNSNLISRTLKLDIGQPVDLARWSEARGRLYDTGVFRRVDIEEEPIDGERPSALGPPEQPVRANVALEERPPLTVRYGLQVNDETNAASATRQSSLGLSGDATYRNLFGHALSAGVAAQFDRDVRAVRSFVTVPSLASRPITSNFFVSRSRQDFGQASTRPFVTDKIDLTAEQRVRPLKHLEVAYSYNYQWNHTFDLQPRVDDPFAFDLTVHVAGLRGTVFVDTRDDLVDATRGWFHSSNVEYASEALGSDVRFAKYVVQQYFYRSIGGGIVLASAGRLGLATGFGQELIPSERFFAGGGNSVRGYAQDTLGPIDVFGSSTGGDALLVLNQEIRFPVFKWFRGVGFLDAGNAFRSVGELSIAGLRPAVGFGTRIQTPFALIRIDYGVPLNRKPTELRSSWIFSVGQVF